MSDAIPPTLRAELDNFDRSADEILMAIARTLDAKEPPPTIYHYTNAAGLRGIIESGRLWLTDIFYLNDPSELSHGFAQAISLLNDRTKTGHHAAQVFAKAFANYGTDVELKRPHFFLLARAVRAVMILVNGEPMQTTAEALRSDLKRAR